MTLETLLVFTHRDCPHSRALLDDFRGRGVVFVEVELGDDPEALRRLRGFSWESRVPVIVDHERVSIGFRGGFSTFVELGMNGD